MPKPKLGYTRPIQVYLRPEQHRALVIAAAVDRVTVSDLVREEVRKIVARYENYARSEKVA